MHRCIRWITVSLILLLAALPASAINPDSLTRDLTKVYDMADVSTLPVPIKRSAPFYAPELRAAKVHWGSRWNSSSD